MGLTKKEHWDTRAFNQYLLDKKDSEFAWGENDCCLFAANSILAITGTDIADDFRGKYTDEASAFELIGIVTGVQHMSRHEVVVLGQEAHAGPTPMEMRRDPIRVWSLQEIHAAKKS